MPLECIYREEMMSILSGKYLTFLFVPRDPRSLVVLKCSQLRTLPVNVLGQAEDTQTMHCGPPITNIDNTDG